MLFTEAWNKDIGIYLLSQTSFSIQTYQAGWNLQKDCLSLCTEVVHCPIPFAPFVSSPYFAFSVIFFFVSLLEFQELSS